GVFMVRLPVRCHVEAVRLVGMVTIETMMM
ncbi:MAG: hypothetical protein QOG75_2631, partial [Mycobacterium sp.]|nr:hypothetical protein [Mycobacterium sp.]